MPEQQLAIRVVSSRARVQSHLGRGIFSTALQVQVPLNLISDQCLSSCFQGAGKLQSMRAERWRGRTSNDGRNSEREELSMKFRESPMSMFPWLVSMACSYPGSMADQELFPRVLSKT